ncbi:MAG: hypothetical protein GX458_00930 [Phyllobacteriaceae bacterium]|nr:hypothetical protein [Phyllobacteriaceae bacterium]
MSVFRSASLVGACLVMSGCAVSDYPRRYGSEPMPTKEEFADGATLQSDVITALSTATLGKGVTPRGADEWYAVALTGYNVVDMKCDEYLRTIFKFDREKDRFAASMVFADKATGAILTASNVAPATVQVVSQSFGLGSTFGTAIADSYLYKIRPASVAGTVQKMRATFRTSVAAGMAARRTSGATAPIHSAETAFQSIREYRSLCYPETIEAKIEDMLAASSGAVKNTTTTDSSSGSSTAKVAPATTAAPQVVLETK